MTRAAVAEALKSMDDVMPRPTPDAQKELLDRVREEIRVKLTIDESIEDEFKIHDFIYGRLAHKARTKECPREWALNRTMRYFLSRYILSRKAVQYAHYWWRSF